MSFMARLESLYRAERCKLFTYALSILRDEGLSEDVVQDVFQRLCDLTVDAEDLRSFVYKSVRNRALDLLRRENRKKGDPGAERSASIYAIDNPRQEESTLSEERARKLENALNSLEDLEREVIVLRIYGGLTFEEVSKILEVPGGTVASRYRRGLAKMRRKLEGGKV